MLIFRKEAEQDKLKYLFIIIWVTIVENWTILIMNHSVLLGIRLELILMEVRIITQHHLIYGMFMNLLNHLE
nr:MAG TPA: hypothetical protein [Caudoviricetes sp.]